MSESKVDVVATVKGNAAEEWAKIAKEAGNVEEATKKAETATKEWEAAGTKAAVASQRSWEQTKKSVAQTAQGVRDAGTVVLAVAAAAAAATVAGAVANERQQRALQALGPAYAEVQRATQGTVTATEAWRVQQALLQSGLPTTGRELATITRAARDYAVATGTETPAAIEQLSQALINGEAGGLRRFGISVQQGATRTDTFNSALRQLQQTQASTAPQTRTLAEDVSHFGATLTEAGGALAGFLSNALGVPDALEAVGGSVRRLTGNLTDFLAFRNEAGHRNNQQDRNLRVGANARPTAAQQRLIDEGNAAGMRAEQSALERASRPASGGGGGGPDVSEAARRAQIWVTERENAERSTKARAAAEAELARMLNDITTAENVAAEATKTRTAAIAAQWDEQKTEAIAALQVEHDLVDVQRRGSVERLALLRDASDAENALAVAVGRGNTTQRDRATELTATRNALQGLLSETTARIETLRAEQASQESINAVLRERIGIQQSLTQVTTQLAETQRANTEATHAFADAMGGAGLSSLTAITDAAYAAADANESLSAAVAKAIREQLLSLSKQAVVEALKNTALGIAAVVTNPVAAPNFFAAAGAWAGVAALSGGIAAAIPKPAAPSSAGSDRAASANAARAPGEASGPLTLQINVNGFAMSHEGVQEAIIGSLNLAGARGLFPRQARN